MFSTSDSTVKGVEGVAKRTLNWMNGNRIISIQEAIFEIDELPLVICSEHIQDVFINNFFKLKKKCLISNDAFLQYLNRTSHMNLSFSQYFYNIIAPTIKKKQIKRDYLKSVRVKWNSCSSHRL